MTKTPTHFADPRHPDDHALCGAKPHDGWRSRLSKHVSCGACREALGDKHVSGPRPLTQSETEYLADLLTRNEMDLRTLARNTPALLGGITASADAVAALRDLLYANLRAEAQYAEDQAMPS